MSEARSRYFCNKERFMFCEYTILWRTTQSHMSILCSDEHCFRGESSYSRWTWKLSIISRYEFALEAKRSREAHEASDEAASIETGHYP